MHYIAKVVADVDTEMSLALVHRYGDRAPISVLGRVLAIVVILTGLVLFGLVNGVLATSITSVALETDYKIYGAKVTGSWHSKSKRQIPNSP